MKMFSVLVMVFSASEAMVLSGIFRHTPLVHF